jgi:hypothetical protein
LPKASDRYKYLFMSIDTFTKWIKSRSIVNITQEAAVHNGTQFKSKKFERCCVDFDI